MEKGLVIRPLRALDIPDVARWIAATPLWQRYGVTEESMAERLRRGLACTAGLYVAERAGEVLGLLWYVEHGAFDRSGYVRLLGVRPEQRGHGVGRALLEYAEGQCFSGGRDLFLLVSDFNTRAQAFYGRLGYREAGRLQDYVIPGVAELILWKPHTEME